MSEKWNLTEVVPELLKFRNERNWEQFHKPKELASAINIESAELLEHFLWRDQESLQNIKNDEKRYRGIQEEIADIVIYLLYLTNDLNINLNKAIISKLAKNTKKYPVNEYRGKF